MRKAKEVKIIAENCFKLHAGSLNPIDGENVEVNGIIKIFITVMCFLSVSHSLLATIL